jgi:hypothetical protein
VSYVSCRELEILESAREHVSHLGNDVVVVRDCIEVLVVDPSNSCNIRSRELVVLHPDFPFLEVVEDLLVSFELGDGMQAKNVILLEPSDMLVKYRLKYLVSAGIRSFITRSIIRTDNGQEFFDG